MSTKLLVLVAAGCDHPGHRLHPQCRAAPGLDDQPPQPLRLRGPRNDAIDGHLYTNSREAFDHNYALLRQHPDAHFILDSKWSRFEIYNTILSQAPERSVRERIMPHI